MCDQCGHRAKDSCGAMAVIPMCYHNDILLEKASSAGILSPQRLVLSGVWWLRIACTMDMVGLGKVPPKVGIK